MQLALVTIALLCAAANGFTPRTLVSRVGVNNAGVSMSSRTLHSRVQLRMCEGAAAIEPAAPVPMPAIAQGVAPVKNSKAWDMYLKTTDTLTTFFPVWTVRD